MSDAIPITYATRAGSTAGVAEYIGGTLCEQGLTAEIRPIQDVTDRTLYAAVVAGSPIQSKQ